MSRTILVVDDSSSLRTVVRLALQRAGYAVIEAGWRAYSLPDRKVKASRTFVDREALESDGYPALVAAQSRLLSRMADDIAAALR